jgi:hypothetical protein
MLVGVYIALRWVACVLKAGDPIDDVIMGAQQVPFSSPASKPSTPYIQQAAAALQSGWLLWYLVVR